MERSVGAWCFVPCQSPAAEGATLELQNLGGETHTALHVTTGLQHKLCLRCTTSGGNYQLNLFRSILGFSTSSDLMTSSHVMSRLFSADMRAMMQESADSTPASAWL